MKLLQRKESPQIKLSRTICNKASSGYQLFQLSLSSSCPLCQLFRFFFHLHDAHLGRQCEFVYEPPGLKNILTACFTNLEFLIIQGLQLPSLWQTDLKFEQMKEIFLESYGNFAII